MYSVRLLKAIVSFFLGDQKTRVNKKRWPVIAILAYTMLGPQFTLSKAIDEEQYPSAGANYPMDVYFGDTHLHTNLSLDAYALNKRIGPEKAYRFARGEAVIDNNGLKRQLRRPLDFLVIADHAVNMGLYAYASNNELDLTTLGFTKTEIKGLLQPDKASSSSQREQQIGRLNSQYFAGSPAKVLGSEAFTKSVWADVTARADHFNAPGKFTAFSGFEWTPMDGGSHRVVIFKDSAEQTNQVLPFSRAKSEAPEDLWQYMNHYEKITSGEVMAILHNSNVSFGQRKAFALQDSYGKALTQQYAKTRMRWEPLVEVTQTKGDSETHPLLAPDDKFANFERWNNWGGSYYGEEEASQLRSKDPLWEKILSDQVDGQALQYKYIRSALKLGLSEQVKAGVNPFKFGVIGSTDSHAGLSVVDNDNYREPTDIRMFKRYGIRWLWEEAASGYAAVWAEENTREALFTAMKRKEVYATTGPRMRVRFFGGWEYKSVDAHKPDLAAIGYAKGVPMGADLAPAPKGKSPRFLIQAVKDPDGANLDRVQVIKGWIDPSGEMQERVYDVSLSDNRKIIPDGQSSAVGSTVDIADASYANTIGTAELATVWTDPDFNPQHYAFYYARVLEIPTPRWTAYDAKYFELKDLPDNIPMVTQERAYTSPIWYQPK